MTLIIVFSLFLCANCFAQGKIIPQPAQSEAEIRMMVYQYKAELGLTDKQEGDLKKILGNFQDYFIDNNKKLSTFQAELGEMIKNREDLKKIRKQLEKMAIIQMDATCFNIEISRKVEGVLTSEQLVKWNAIQADFQKMLQERMKAAQAKQKT